MTVNSYMIQLQHINYTSLSSQPFDLMIVDRNDSGLTSSQIDSLQAQGKEVVSYISIGEAEVYRDYWESSWNSNPPSFIDEENPDWPGNYKVKYWDSEWQDIILSDIKEIATAGYNGAFLDIVDAYWGFREQGYTNALQDMIDFVKDIAATGRAINPDFEIIANNGLELLEHSEFLNTIDGVLKESTWYDENGAINASWTPFDLEYLKIAVDAGKLVLSLDYPAGKFADEYIAEAQEFGTLPFVGTRALSSVSEVNVALAESLKTDETSTQEPEVVVADNTETPTQELTYGDLLSKAKGASSTENTSDSKLTYGDLLTKAEDKQSASNEQENAPQTEPEAENQVASLNLTGSNSADEVGGDSGNDWLSARKGNDYIHGQDGDDTIFGGKGDDIVDGGAGNDRINGDNNNDLIYGGEGDDHVNGGKGNDIAFGDNGDDMLSGGKGNDTISGGAGNDTINGDQNNDMLYGGEGSDLFVFERRSGHDTIKDFGAGDRISLLGTSLDDFTEVLEHSQVKNGSIVIDLGRSDTLTLEGITDITADDFMF